MDGLKAVDSVYVAGQWRDATWLAEVVDPETGELVLTATVDGPDGGSAPVVCALRLTGNMLRGLRRTAGFEGPLPVDVARAKMAVWRRGVELAIAELEMGETGAQIVLRQLLELGGEGEMDGEMDEMDEEMDGPCYDCRMTNQRLTAKVDRIWEALRERGVPLEVHDATP